MIPIEVPGTEERSETDTGSAASSVRQAENEPDRARDSARDTLGRTLRRAFPLPDSGSFTRLLEALEEAQARMAKDAFDTPGADRQVAN